MTETIKRLIEQRILEATKKQLTKKMHCVAEYMGRPIIQQFNASYTPFADVWALQEEDLDTGIVTADDDSGQETIGYYFDGLKYGTNLCIKTEIYDDQLKKVKTTFNGYLVFAEYEGQIKAYAPFQEWEHWIDMLYEAAERRRLQKIETNNKLHQEKSKKKVETILSKLRKLWGI